MIDSLYEYAGYSLSGLLHGVLSGLGLPLLLGLAGTAWLVHAVASDRAAPRQIVVHVLYLILAWSLLSPARKADVGAPRLAVWLGEGADLLQKRAIRTVNGRFLESPLAWERLAALASFATILDPALKGDVDAFLHACATPALAQAGPAGDDLLADGALPYDAACERRRAELRTRIVAHVETDPLHRAALDAAAAHDPGGAAAFRSRYESELCRRAVDDPGSPTSEAALVAASLGAYSYTDGAQSTGAFPSWAKGLLAVPAPLGQLWDFGANAAITGIAQLTQSWSNRFSSKQKYYLSTIYGPHVYGLALLFLLGLFPLAGLWALLPGRWTALVHWGKVFLSVKLWPVCWAVLTCFNAKRSALEAFDPGPRGSGDVFLAVSAFYLLVPTISFLIVQLGATAVAMPFSPALPSPAGVPAPALRR